MVKRCYCENQPNYRWYGARGITVCDEWRHESYAFVNWAAENGYAPHKQIDRIDNDKGYSPENCRWVTVQEQNQNKRHGKNKSLPGTNAVPGGYQARISINGKRTCVGFFKTEQEAHEAYRAAVKEHHGIEI